MGSDSFIRPALKSNAQRLASGLILIFFAGSAFAVTFTVNSRDDIHDADLTDGICLADGSVCTLRAAVEQTNFLAGKDTIVLPGVIPGGVSFRLTQGELGVFDDLVVVGSTDPALPSEIDANARVTEPQRDFRAIRVDSSEWLVCDTNNARVMVVDHTGATAKEFIPRNSGGLQIPADIEDAELNLGEKTINVLGWGSGLHLYDDSTGRHRSLRIPVVLGSDFFSVGDLLVLSEREELLVTRAPDGPDVPGRVLRYKNRTAEPLPDFFPPGTFDIRWPVALLKRVNDLTGRLEVLVLDHTNNQVYVFDETGSPLRIEVLAVQGGVQVVDEPVDMEFDADGNLYILMAGTELVAKFNRSGSFIENFVPPGQIDEATDMAFGVNGNLYIANTGAGNIIRYEGRTGSSMGVFMATGLDGIGRPTCLYPRGERAERPILELNDVTVTNGLVANEPGGGILVGPGGILKLNDAFVHSNTSFGSGGGLAVYGRAIVSDSTISRNTAEPTQDCSVLGTSGVRTEGGGGIAVFDDATLRLLTTILRVNKGWNGGSLANFAGEVDIVNSTISENSSSAEGGGIFSSINLQDHSGSVSMLFTTITRNSAATCPEALHLAILGGGIAGISYILQSSILAGNEARPSGVGADCSLRDGPFPALLSGGGNVIGVVGSRCDYTPSPAFPDQTGTAAAPLDPGLDGLNNNGGPNETHALLPGSPAIDGGESSRCPNFAPDFDQRGFPRVLDGDIDGVIMCDSGAFELMPTTDSDGIPDAVEDAGRNGGDGNRDGIPDRSQPNVVSFPNIVNGLYYTLVSSDLSTFEYARSIANPSPGDTPPEAVFPLGHLTFRVDLVFPQNETIVDVLLPAAVRVENYFKYGKTPDLPSDHWYDFAFDGDTGADFPELGRIVLHFEDAQRGDDDLLTNRSIIDPGAPGFNRTATGIDYKPSTQGNPLNPTSAGREWIAFLSDADFDATQINTGSIAVGPGGAPAWRSRRKVDDVDGNGYPDLLVRFETKKAGVRCGDTELHAKAQTPGGDFVIGTDAIRTVGCD